MFDKNPITRFNASTKGQPIKILLSLPQTLCKTLTLFMLSK